MLLQFDVFFGGCGGGVGVVFRMLQVGSHRMNFCEICYLELLRESVAKMKIWLLSDKDIGHLT